MLYTTKLQLRGIRWFFLLCFFEFFFDWFFKVIMTKIVKLITIFFVDFNMPLTANNNNKTARDWSSFKNLSNFYVSRPVNKNIYKTTFMIAILLFSIQNLNWFNKWCFSWDMKSILCKKKINLLNDKKPHLRVYNNRTRCWK